MARKYVASGQISDNGVGIGLKRIAPLLAMLGILSSHFMGLEESFCTLTERQHANPLGIALINKVYGILDQPAGFIGGFTGFGKRNGV